GGVRVKAHTAHVEVGGILEESRDRLDRGDVRRLRRELCHRRSRESSLQCRDESSSVRQYLLLWRTTGDAWRYADRLAVYLLIDHHEPTRQVEVEQRLGRGDFHLLQLLNEGNVVLRQQAKLHGELDRI